jgi:hypothetical protein
MLRRAAGEYRLSSDAEVHAEAIRGTAREIIETHDCDSDPVS